MCLSVRGLGSSPRLRGTRNHLSLLVGCIGIIPRLRGTRHGQRVCGATHGIIPALAGNTHLLRTVRSPSWDHPRACGEHFLRDMTDERDWGSSPRLRGTRTEQSAKNSRSGIIPALAGNTFFLGVGIGGSGDHPRACGEHRGMFKPGPRTHGSSPRLRGTRNHIPNRNTDTGIIPALAGNTRTRTARTAKTGAHPRACGEHRGAKVPRSGHQGSSPRLRGTLRVVMIGS